MLYSKLYSKTDKSIKNYESINATLLIKAGFIDQVSAGVYTFLPLGLKVLTNIEQIVRAEMNKIGVEVLMPTLAPISNWKITKRFNKVNVLLKAIPANDNAKKVHDAEYVVSPTHEEIVTPLAKKFIKSYKDLPCAYYQIQTKYRNEPRAKSGLLRGREFRMKDLYSFHPTDTDFRSYYDKAKIAYMNIYKKLGLGDDTLIVLASGGDFTDEYSHEFQTICHTGEDTIFRSKKLSIAYNREVAPARAPRVQYQDEIKPKEDVKGEGIVGVTDLAKYLNIPVEKTTKTLFYEISPGSLIAVAVRGGYDVNEYKLCKTLGIKSVKLATPDKIREVTGAEVGYAGVLNLPEDIRIYFDESCQDRVNFETGANKTNYHTVNVNFGRDLPLPNKFYDIKDAKAGDICPDDGEVYETFAASEVGNIFPLGTKYSDDFELSYSDEKGISQKVYMGCYGIGISRLIGVIVEKFHDDHGMIWPVNIAPFKVHLISIKGVESKANEIYEKLIKSGIDVLWDDRDESAGVKFADCDLIGIPYRLVVSPKTGDKIEVKKRTEKEAKLVSVDEVLSIFSK